MKANVALSIAGCVALLAMPGATETKPDKEAALRGRTTYLRYCVSCHGKEARGDGPLAIARHHVFPDLTSIAIRNGGTYDYDRVVRIIMKGSEVKGHGTDDMPAWGPAFNRTDGMASMVAAIRDLSHFLWSVQRSE